MSNVLTRLELQILRYLQDNVDAAETAGGVNSMWLQRPATAACTAEVESALASLVARGLLEKHTLPGGTAIYRKARM